MPAPTQEQVSWYQALGSDGRCCQLPSVPRRLAGRQPLPRTASLPEVFQRESQVPVKSRGRDSRLPRM
jgi:hypothetical protein